MNFNELKEVFENRMTACMETLFRKGNLYAPTDRFANFKKAGALSGNHPLKALYGMWVKHVVAIADYVNLAVEKGVDEVLYKEFMEKFTDNINYTILAEGILKEMMEGKI